MLGPKPLHIISKDSSGLAADSSKGSGSVFSCLGILQQYNLQCDPYWAGVMKACVWVNIYIYIYIHVHTFKDDPLQELQGFGFRSYGLDLGLMVWIRDSWLRAEALSLRAVGLDRGLGLGSLLNQDSLRSLNHKP